MKIICFFLIMISFIACNKTVSTVSVDDSSTLELDTLKDNSIYLLDTISEKEFLSLPETGNLYINCEGESVIDDAKVTIRDTVLTFQLQNGTIKELVSSSKALGNYCYKTSLNELNQWVVCVGCGDEHSYSLFIDKNTGKETGAVSFPVLSPNKKYFVCYKMNWTGYHIIQLFKIEENKEISEVWYKLLTDWGVSDVRWKDDNTIYLQKESMWETEDNKIVRKLNYLKYPLQLN